MEFRIADTFTDSLARLTGDEQKAVKTTAFDLQINPTNPGLNFHKLEKAKFCGRARAAVMESGMAFKVLDERVESTSSHVSISTMHLAKGLEFRAVVVMACDDEVIPLQERIETVGDDADLQEVYDTDALRRLHARERPFARDECRAGVGVPR